MNNSTKTGYAIVVVYNKAISESVTIETIKDSPYRILVVDNSTKDFNNHELAADFGYEYLSMDGNKGLSKAYNAAIDYVRGKADFITLFDDDTKVSPSFLAEIFAKFNSETDIYLPIISSDKRIISPCRYHGHNRTFTNISEIASEKTLSAINSAMTISLSVFDDYRYDENLFLDYVDHRFMTDMNQIGKKVIVLDSEIYQNFSMDERGTKGSLPGAKIRYNLFYDDIKYFFQDSFIKRYSIMLKYGLRISLSYRTPSFALKAIFLRKFSVK